MGVDEDGYCGKEDQLNDASICFQIFVKSGV